MRTGAREPLYSWQRTVPGAGVPKNPPQGADGTPEKPGCGRVISLNWELLVPSVAPSGTLADWNDTYPSLPNPTTLLPLIEWTKGLAPLGAFGKQNLLIDDFNVFLGGDVTDVNASFATTSINTRLYVDDGAGGQFVAFESTAWPSSPSGPSYTYLTWASSQKALLGTNHPKAYLRIQNNHGSTTLGTGHIRCQMRVLEI